MSFFFICERVLRLGTMYRLLERVSTCSILDSVTRVKHEPSRSKLTAIIAV